MKPGRPSTNGGTAVSATKTYVYPLVIAERVEANVHSGDYDFIFKVRMPEAPPWMIKRSFDQLARFNKDLCKRFGSEHVPYFPAKGLFEGLGLKAASEKKATKRLAELENFLKECVSRQDEWMKGEFVTLFTAAPLTDVAPTVATGKKPKTSSGAGGPQVEHVLASCLTTFFEFEENYEVPEFPLGGPTPAPAPTSTAPSASFAISPQSNGRPSAGTGAGTSGAIPTASFSMPNDNNTVTTGTLTKASSDDHGQFPGELETSGEEPFGEMIQEEQEEEEPEPEEAEEEEAAQEEDGFPGLTADMTGAEAYFTALEMVLRREGRLLAGATPLVVPKKNQNTRRSSTSVPATSRGFSYDDTIHDDDEDDDFDDFVLLDDDATTRRERHEAIVFSALTMTARIQVHVQDFVILADRIDYIVFVSLFGHGWTVTKRYSEFEALHMELQAFYGGKGLPSLDAAKVPVWKKCEPKTGKKRQAFFTKYLQAVVSRIDTWEPREYIMSLPFCQDGKLTEACLNAFFFNFLDFPSHTEDFALEVAVATLEQRKTELPQNVLEAMAVAKTEEQAINCRRNFELRRKKFGLLREDEIQRFCSMLRQFDDDRDALDLVQQFVKQGYFLDARLPPPPGILTGQSMLDVFVGMTPLVNTKPVGNHAPVNNASISMVQSFGSLRMMASDQLGTTSFALTVPAAATNDVLPSFASAGTNRFGITSHQVALIAESIPFNDTRTAAILLLAPVLLDDYHWAEIFGTLYSGWEATENQMKEELGKRLDPK